MRLKAHGINIPQERLRWISDANLERMKKEHGAKPIKDYEKQGDLTLCEMPEKPAPKEVAPEIPESKVRRSK